MRIPSKLIGVPALVLTSALCSYGAGWGSSFPSRAAFKPMVTEGAQFALGVNLDKKQAFKIVDAYVDQVFEVLKISGKVNDKEIAEMKGEIASFKEDPFKEAPEDVRTFLERSGLRDAEFHWALLSLENFRIADSVPQLDGIALAVAGTIDLKRFIEALRQEKVVKAAFEETRIEGETAWRIVPWKDDKEMEDAHVDPHLTSLDGQLVLVATSRETLVKQIRLYRTWRGHGDALDGFSAADGELLHLHLSGIGDLVRKYAPRDELKGINQVVPAGDQLVLGLGDLDVDDKVLPNGTLNSSLSLRTASEKDADTLRTLAKTGLMVLNAKIAQEPKVPDFVKKLVWDIKVGGADSQFEVRSPIPIGTGCMILPAALFPAISSATLNANAMTLSFQGRKLIMGIIQANIDRQGKSDPLWPRTKLDENRADKVGTDVADRTYGSSPDYFRALFDMEHYGKSEWDPAVDGELLTTLWGAGVPGMTGRSLESWNVAWTVAANVTDETPDFMPVLISANFNPALLLNKWDGRTDGTRRLPIGPKSGAEKSMLKDRVVVVVRKSGEALVIKQKDLTYNKLYAGLSFDLTNMNPPLKYLTPTGVVTPVGHE